MMAFISRFNYPGLIQVLPASKLNRIALIMLGSLLLAGLLHLAHILATPSNMAVLRNWFALLLIMFVFFIGEQLRRKSKEHLSVLLLCYAVIGILCFTIVKSVGGLRASEIIYLPISLTIAGWLLGGRHALVLYVMETLTLLLVLFVNPAPAVFGGKNPISLGLSPHWLVWLVQQAGLTIATALSIAIGSMFHSTLKSVHHASVTDFLTSLPNRRFFEQYLNEQFIHCQNTNSTMSLIVMDFDHFKKINDTFSHLAGDQALIQLSKLLRTTCLEWQNQYPRNPSIELVCARLGGDEFAIIVPQASQAQALELAQACAQAARSYSWILSDTSAPQHLTLSLGVGEFNSFMTQADELYQLADAALYQVKMQGRNNAAVYCSTISAPNRRKTDLVPA